MKILERIESLLENVFEGISRKGYSSIQPVEIGRKLVKVMEAQRRISIARTYVPNVYVIQLHPDQLKELESLQHTLIRELRGFLLQKAEDKNLSFIGNLKIAFAACSGLEPGKVEIDASFVEASDVLTDEFMDHTSEVMNPEHTQVFSAQDQIRRLPLLLVQGAKKQMTYQIIPGRQSIGRSFQCDLVIEDQNVSRLHAWLMPFGGKWKLIDNDSTNGTYLNDQRIQECVLNDGDQIRVGTTILVFRDGED